MKKLFYLILSISLILTFAGCKQIAAAEEENQIFIPASAPSGFCTFNLAVSNDSPARVVYPSAYDISILFYKFSYLDPNANNTNYPADGTGATYTQISTKTFTLATGDYVFALDAYSDSACTKKILECTQNVTIESTTSSVSLKLKSTTPADDSSATGSVSVKLNFPTTSTVTKVTARLASIEAPEGSVDSKELDVGLSGTAKTITYTNTSVPTGKYILFFTLSGDGVEPTVIPELVVVATGQQSSNEASPIEVTDDQVNTNIVYVSAAGTMFGVGTKSNPFNTLEKAITLINSKNKTETDWAICVSGSLLCLDTLTIPSTLKAKSLVIMGTTSTSTDGFVGNGSQTTLALENEIPVTISHLCITKGGMGGIIVKGSGKVELIGSAVTGCSQSGIRIASFATSDVEIKESIIGGDDTDGNTGPDGGGINKDGSGTLTIIDSTIKGNKSTSDLIGSGGGGGIYLEDGILILGDKANIIENSAKLNGGGILVKGGTVKIKGKVTVQDNTKASGTTSVANNVYLSSSKVLTLADALSDTSSIGFTTAVTPTKTSPVVLTSGLATYSSSLDVTSVFHSDTEEYEVQKNASGQAILTPAEPVASVDGTTYNSLTSTVNAIKNASGDIEVVLLGGTSAADLGSAPTAGTIANAIKTTSASTVTFSIAEGVTITFDDTKNKQLFDGCSKLVSADLRGLDTSNMTLMYRMFADCSKLTSVNLSGFDTSKMTNFVATFLNCFKLTVLDLSSFDTAEMSGMNSTFSSCSRLTTIIVSEKFVNTGVTNPTTGPFEGCTSLVGGKGTVYSSEHTDYTYARIDGGTANPGYFTGIIGTKAKPDAVGDIVFTDGSATPYSAGLTLTTTQKNAAIAVIFYVGTELNNGDDATTTRTLGVGLVQDTKKVWCLGTASAYNIDVENLHCIGAFGGTSQKFTYPFTGVKNGSNALDLISSFLTSQGLTDDTATEANYPAFYFAKNYKSQTNSHVSGTSYEDGWYLPTIAELYWIYKAWTEVDSAMEACGGTKFNGTYATCTQLQSSTTGGYYFYFYPGNTANCVAWNNGGKNNARIPCAIREF